MTSSRSKALVGLLALAALVWMGCSDGGGLPQVSAGGKGSARGRSVLLITVDTTRPDRLEPYGASDVATPNLARLAADGILFEQAYSVAPITLVAHTSIMSGVYPSRHGVRNNGMHYVPPSIRTLAERFADAGYRTAAFVSASVLERRYGLDQGFEVYDDDLSAGRGRVPRMVPDRPAEATVTSAEAWLDTLGEGERFFVWVHFYDPHARYSPPPPYRDDYRARLYDGEIAYMDSQIGRLLEHPAIRGRVDDDAAVVTVVGDHGESLGEHGELTHAILAYDSTLHVPWLLKVPGGPAGVRIRRPVSQVDVAPTLLSLVGVPGGPEIAGRDVIQTMGVADDPDEGGVAYFSETYLPFYTYGWAKLNAVRVGRWKYIDAPSPELYDLRRDPRELSNVQEDRPGIAHDMRRTLQEHLAESDAYENETRLALDEETLESLKALGYMAAGSGKILVDGERGDPKDLIHLHVHLERARQLTEDRLFAPAEQQVRLVLEQDPNNLAAQLELASALEGQGRLDDTVEALKRALELDPDYSRLYVVLARVEMQRGNTEKALELASIAVDRDPRSPDTVIQKASILFGIGRFDEARALLDLSLAESPESPRLNVFYAHHVELREGLLDAAEARARRALDRDPHMATGWYVLGTALDRQGRREEAVESYRSGLKRRSDDVALHGALGQLLADLGRLSEAEPHLREAIRLSPELRPDLQVSLGALEAEKGRFAEAEGIYRRVLEVEPKHAGARNNLAITLFRTGRVKAAEALLEEILVDFPDMPDAQNNVAALAVERGDWKRAELHARRAVELQPEFTEAWNNLAIAEEEQERFDAALLDYRRALEVDPDYWQARFNMGILFRKAGDPRAAAAAFEEVLVASPTLPECHYELAELYAGSLDSPDRARTHYNAFLRHAPEDPRAADVRDRIAQLTANR